MQLSCNLWGVKVLVVPTCIVEQSSSDWLLLDVRTVWPVCETLKWFLLKQSRIYFRCGCLL